MINKWYRKSWSQIVKELDSSSYYGLYDEQIESRRKKYGSNEIMMPDTKSFVMLIIMQFKQIWVVFMLLCMSVLLYFSFFTEAFALVLILAVNCMCVIIDRYKDEENIKELKRLNSGHARVIRNGRTMKIESQDLVVGDIVIVGTGELVPADMRIIECSDLKVDECSVTGQRYLVDKYEPRMEDNEIPLSDIKNMVFKSSTVVKGDTTGIVVAVGMDTQVAEIMRLLLKEDKVKSSFGEKMNEILNMYTIILAAITAGAVALRYVIGLDVSNPFVFSTFMAVSCFPIGFCIILGIISTILLSRLKKNNVDFKNLFSIEKFSKISAICTDKIGSFSRERVDIARSYGSGGFIELDGETLREGMNDNLRRMLYIGILCSGTRFGHGKIQDSKDDLIEISIAKFAEQNGIYRKKVQDEHQRLFQISFDTERRIMTTVNRVGKKYRANVKGTVDSILERCTHILKNGVEVEITEDDMDSIRDADMNMSNDSLNVIGFAYRNFNYEPSQEENIESNLVFVGLIGFENRLKDNAMEALLKASKLSIKPVIITDDSKLTALAVGKKLGIVKRLQQILSGIEMDNMQEEEFKRIGEKINIFSRVNSKHKVEMISALKDYGYTTALTGWKLTDLPALKMSNIGITNMGSNIVKKLSDIFIQDIDFMRLLNLVESSRRIINVIRKIMIYIISTSFSIMWFIAFEMFTSQKADVMKNIFPKSLWSSLFVVFLSSIALISQCRVESTEYNDYSIGRNVVREKTSFMISSGFLIGLLSFLSFKTADFLNVTYFGSIPFNVLNLNLIIFILSFSNKKIFEVRISNIILFLGALLQIGICAAFYGFKMFFDVTYWEVVVLFVVPWFIFCLFRKVDKENYYMYEQDDI